MQQDTPPPGKREWECMTPLQTPAVFAESKKKRKQKLDKNCAEVRDLLMRGQMVGLRALEKKTLNRALRAASSGEPLQIFGDDYPTADGTCVRDFVHVSDLASAHLAGLKSLEAGGPSAAYNLGMGDGVSVRELVASVARVTGRDVPHVIAPRRPGDPSSLVATSARARSALGWTPAYGNLDTIVRTASVWHQANPKGYGKTE